MRNQLRSPEEMNSLAEWVLACVVLHNMLAKIGDKWDEMFRDDHPPQENQLLDVQIESTNNNIRDKIMHLNNS
uniref:DDE Tnp4 domain-containing protein n=1 Tax=Phakopsora pachyrhizi TaxID=170000 RepID=A0A0S1MID1_PHAPC